MKYLLFISLPLYLLDRVTKYFVLHSIDPDMVAFAGGMTAAGPGFLAKIRQYVKELAFPVPAAKCDIRYAELGGNADFTLFAKAPNQRAIRERAVLREEK